ncbi:MAG: class aldolase/adducin family protein [Clostridiales bacterium]|jgi:L-fuculose-phosphate aldolase|nr:class aldolase/adducin family protein [Clostridiales bacterium]
MEIKAIKEVLEVCRRLDQRNLVNAYEGNVSIKRGGYIYITPTGKNKAFLTEEMIAVFEEDTMKQVGGLYPASSEMLLHTNAYQTRPDVSGVIHCHPTMLTAYSLCNKSIESKAYPEMIGNFKKIPCAPYGRPGTDEIFDVAREYVKKNDIVLLGNHGVITVGKDVYDAMNKVEAAEAIAKVLYYAEQVGKIVDLEDSEVEMFLAK